MTIRNAQDEEYLQLEPKKYLHPKTGELIIGIPNTNGQTVQDLYVLHKDADIPKNLEDFAQLELSKQENLRHINAKTQRTTLRSLNYPNWEASQ